MPVSSVKVNLQTPRLNQGQRWRGLCADYWTFLVDRVWFHSIKYQTLPPAVRESSATEKPVEGKKTRGHRPRLSSSPPRRIQGAPRHCTPVHCRVYRPAGDPSFFSHPKVPRQPPVRVSHALSPHPNRCLRSASPCDPPHLAGTSQSQEWRSTARQGSGQGFPVGVSCRHGFWGAAAREWKMTSPARGPSGVANGRASLNPAASVSFCGAK